MDTWQLLTPHYMSEFFTVWYTHPLVIAILFVLLVVIFPFQLFLIGLTKQADKQKGDTWDKVKRWRLLILVHKAKQTRQSKAYWVCFASVWVLGTGYFCVHYYLCKNPDILTTGSLQTLNRDDFEVALQFFQRWVASGWVLMLFSLAFFLNYLEKGITQLKYSSSITSLTNEISDRGTGTASELYKPRLEIRSYGKSPTDPQRFADSFIASPNTRVFLSKQATISTNAETPFITFEYREASAEHQGGWHCIKDTTIPRNVYLDENKLELNELKKLTEFHWFRWTIGKQMYWCRVIVR